MRPRGFARAAVGLIALVIGLAAWGAGRGLPVTRLPWHWTTTLAGAGRGYLDGPAVSARFDGPQGLAVAADGALYIADTYNHRIRRLSPDGRVSTVAGGGRLGYDGGGFADGDGTTARFRYPRAIAIDAHGDLYVADTNNHAIRKIAMADPAHPHVSTLAGGRRGLADGPGDRARFWNPWGLAAAPDGTLYVADTYNNRIRRVSATGEVRTLAGGGPAGPGGGGSVDAAGAAARFYRPVAIALAPAGTLYVADAGNRCIRLMTLDGRVGSFSASVKKRDAEGIPADVPLIYPAAIARDHRGHWFVLDAGTHRVLKLGDDGALALYAGTIAGRQDGPWLLVRFNRPSGLAFDAEDRLIVADSGNHLLRRIDAAREP